MAIKKMLALFFCFVLVFLSVIPAYAADDALPFELRDDQVLVFSYAVTELSDFLTVSESALLVEGCDYTLYVYLDGSLYGDLSSECIVFPVEEGLEIPILYIPFSDGIFVYSHPEVGTWMEAPSLTTGVVFDLYVVQNNVHIPDVATSGLSVVLDWIGIVLGSFLSPSGVLFPLFVLLLVGVSISLLLFVIKVFRLFFWGF